jgi:hypothetical protein
MEQCVRRKFGTAVGSYIVAEYRSRVTPDTALALCELVSYEAPSVDLCSHNDVLVRATTAPSCHLSTINRLVSQLMVLWFKVSLELLYRHRLSSHQDVRPHLSLLCASCLLFWPLFDTNGWSWRLNTLVPVTLLFRLIYKGAIRKDAQDVEVQCFSRSGALPSELLLGPLQWMVCLIYLGLYQFMTWQACVTAAAIFGGDGCWAPWLGQAYGRHVYQMPLSRPKTMEGTTVGVFLGTVVGSYGLLLWLALPDWPPLRVMLVYGALAAVAEGTAPGHWDNLFVGLVLQATLDRVPLWLPAAVADL